MPDNVNDERDLKPLYAARLAEDLERNATEQECLSSEIAVLQEKLEKLRHNQSLLVRMERALGDADTAHAGTAPAADADVPSPRQADTGVEARLKSVAWQEKETGGRPPLPGGRGAAHPKAGSAPTLRDLVVRHLGRQSRSLSAVEVNDALAEAYPDRNIKITVVRSTLEAMVAKGAVRRSKQGKFVFYTVGPRSAVLIRPPSDRRMAVS
ncbi:hypothetical protein ACIQNG_18735 [Streptomyces sp. NPDC091377]|uniref:hypothetical protein n=1 Tax=unclassified Streptomyces TaxID=2593676 RepID=UPI003826BB9D